MMSCFEKAAADEAASEKIKIRFGQEFALMEDANLRVGMAMLNMAKATIEAEAKVQRLEREKQDQTREYDGKIFQQNSEISRLNAQLHSLKKWIADRRKRARKSKKKTSK